MSREIIVCAAQCGAGEEHDAAYRLLALVLRREYGLDALPGIAHGTNGKPFFPHHPALHFSISHSRGALALALHERPIGIDLERLRPAPRRLSQGEDALTFFRRWTALEATVKREGGNIAAAWRAGQGSDPLCCTREDLLPGWIITVCPSVRETIRWEVFASL